MSDNKKYYYLKLKDNFFESDNMILLESMKDGYLYSNILLKLYLKSLKDNGRLVLNGRIPYNSQMIANVTRHQVGTVERALKIFEELGLVETLDSGVIYMLDIQNFVGESSTEADRKREYRSRIEQEKTDMQVPGHLSGQMSDKNPPEIRDRDKDRDKNKYNVCFESVWKAYPRKKEKAAAYKAYSARLKDGYSEEELLKAAEAYAKECREKHTEERYIKHGKTFFGPSTPFIDYLDGQQSARTAPGQQDDFEEPSYYQYLGNRTPSPDDPFQ